MKFSLTKSPDLVLGGEPRVNLLPPELAQKAVFRKTRSTLAGVVIIALVAVGAGFGVAQYRLMAAQSDLAAAQQRTTELLAEQGTYADAVSATALVASGERARTLGTSTEVLWNDMFGAIQAFLPDGVTIVSGTMTGRAPWEPELLPAGPLRQPRVGTLTLVVSSPTVLDATDIVRRLSALEGFADATPAGVTMEESTYMTTIMLNVGEEALSGRFATETPVAEAQG
ncbi:hypothetical protein [Marisediminicola senii]|uniref:hypothetical protein n=1 Tax=Marisediminicola senii TaxID=2711233 RepID=UPI0013EB8238|nr:hypothetical protein [Marisediminicola senii]